MIKQLQMPSLRKKVSTYFRQLSFVKDDRCIQPHLDDSSFIVKYLETGDQTVQGPEILSSKDPSQLPELLLADYGVGVDLINASVTGPDDGFIGIKRNKLHLSVGSDIEFIDKSEKPNTKLAKNISAQINVAPILLSSPSKNDFHNSESQQSINISANQIENIEEIFTPVEGIQNWKLSTDFAYGLSLSLYERNLVSGEKNGSPIADNFGLISRKDSAILVIADGVNWGTNSKIAAMAATFGCIEYLSTAIFGQTLNQRAKSTRDVFISLLRSFSEAHATILEAGGSLTTLTASVVLPLSGANKGKFVVCSCNVGDSLGYIYSKQHGVREFTKDSHNILVNRDMRNALGALGPANGNRPELGNLTLSLTICDVGDIVFLCSDGITDNFDPVVGKFAEVCNTDNKSKQSRSCQSDLLANKMSLAKERNQRFSLSNNLTNTTQICQEKQCQGKTTVAHSVNVETKKLTRPRYLRSQTLIDNNRIRCNKQLISSISRSKEGLPLITSEQRHTLSLLRMAEIFSYGLHEKNRPCATAKRACHLLMDFAIMITSAKRKFLEQPENYYKTIVDGKGGRKQVPMNRNQQRACRKRVIETEMFAALPGKLDHASCVAWCIPSLTTEQSTSQLEFKETYF